MNTSTSRRTYVHQFKEPKTKEAYHANHKQAGVLDCPTCRAVSSKGRWMSRKDYLAKIGKKSFTPEGPLKCPACRQQEDSYALGVIELHGTRWKDHLEDVMNTIRNTEDISRARNNQQRVMSIEENRGTTQVFVTQPELARKIGRELKKAFKGTVEYSKCTEEGYLRVRWLSDGLTEETQAPKGSELPRSKSFRRRGE